MRNNGKDPRVKLVLKPLSAALFLSGLVRGYQLSIGMLIGPSCRFFPSCSQYCREALALHGAQRGLWLSAKRILRCHPLSEGGLDPVPGSPPLKSLL